MVFPQRLSKIEPMQTDLWKFRGGSLTEMPRCISLFGGQTRAFFKTRRGGEGRL